MLKIVGLLILGTFMVGNDLQGQDKKPDNDAVNLKLNLSLHNVVDLAIGQSSAIRYIQNTNVNSFWRWKNFQKTFLPNLVVSGTLPNFNQSTVPVTQPDGSIEFKEVSNLMGSANLSLNQSIPLTGTYIYASTSASRVQDYYKSKQISLVIRYLLDSISPSLRITG